MLLSLQRILFIMNTLAVHVLIQIDTTAGNVVSRLVLRWIGTKIGIIQRRHFDM